MRQFTRTANQLSILLFALSLLLLVVWVDIGPLLKVAPRISRLIPTSWTRTRRLPGLSNATHVWVRGTEQIALTTDPSFLLRHHPAPNLTLYRIKLVPVYSKEKGPDGLPLYGLYDPDIIELVRIRLSWIITCLVVSSILPFTTFARRARMHRQRGFPIQPYRNKKR